MKVLITGASGFIGRRVVERLARSGHTEVIAASRSGSPSTKANVLSYAVDLLEPGATERMLRETAPTHLMHLAWNAVPGQFWTSADNLSWAAATLDLMRRFADSGGLGAVFAGSCAEYDWTVDGVLAEHQATEPATLYGTVKDATRRAICAFGTQSGLPVAWGRVFWLYGPGEASGRLVSDVARALAEGRPVKIGDGCAKRDFLHVDDVAAAFVRALDTRHQGVFNIGSGRAVTIRSIVEALADASGRPDLIQFGARPTPANEPPMLVADTTLLRRELNWSPAIDLEAGLRDTYGWWTDQAVPQ